MPTPQIARFTGPTWGPSGADRAQMGPMLAPWTLLSGSVITRDTFALFFFPIFLHCQNKGYLLNILFILETSVESFFNYFHIWQVSPQHSLLLWHLLNHKNIYTSFRKIKDVVLNDKIITRTLVTPISDVIIIFSATSTEKFCMMTTLGFQW